MLPRSFEIKITSANLLGTHRKQTQNISVIEFRVKQKNMFSRQIKTVESKKNFTRRIPFPTPQNKACKQMD